MNLYYYLYMNVLYNKNAFSTITIPAIIQASNVVSFRLTRLPISDLLLVKIIRGTRAKAIPNERITWLATSAFVALIPPIIIMSGGSMVIALRRYKLIR